MLVAGPNVSRVLFKVGNKRRLMSEWSALSKKNPALYSIVSYLAGYSGLVLNRDLVVTQIWRSDAEQKQIYGATTKKRSPHQDWCAVDLRCRDFNLDERSVLEEALRKYDSMNKFRHLPSSSRTVWIHKVANGGIHFHIQYSGSKRELPSMLQLPQGFANNVA